MDSSTVALDVVEPDDDEGVEAAWRLKERIRAAEGIFQQERSFFVRAYREATVYRLVRGSADSLLGFAAVQQNGYMMFLAVAEEARGRGYGRRLVGAVSDDHPRVTCHVRATNENAIGFYEHVGFELDRRAVGYYADGTDALYLELED